MIITGGEKFRDNPRGARHKLKPFVHHRTLLPRHLTSSQKGKSVTHVSGTICYLCLGRSYKSCDINQCLLADELDGLSSPAATQGMPVELFAGFTRFYRAGTSTKNSTHARGCVPGRGRTAWKRDFSAAYEPAERSVSSTAKSV